MSDDARRRLAGLADRWQVDVRSVRVTSGSLLGFGVAGERRVVLKIVRFPHEEWNAGGVIAAFGGQGMVRALAHRPGAMLLEELQPATPLSELVRSGRDDDALGVLSRTIAAMQAEDRSTAGVPTALDWGRAFARDPGTIPGGLLPEVVREGEQAYLQLCRTQGRTRLLHGDLHHENVLLDAARGWLAIDPKGVVAELEFEAGAALRNPPGMPELMTARALERRAAHLALSLGMDAERVIRWAFAQSVLSELWTLEDGGTPDPEGPALRLAASAREILS